MPRAATLINSSAGALCKLVFLSLPCLIARVLPDAGQSDKPGDSYPNAKLLAEPNDLMDGSLPNPTRIVDVRAAKAYREGHIPGAIQVDAESWSKRSREPKALENTSLWSGLVGSLGIERHTTVVVYDQSVTPNSARVWWLLRYVGVADVRLLNGGLAAWREHGGKLSRDDPQIPPAHFEPKFQKHMLADRELVRKTLGEEGTCLVDARSQEEFTGARVQGPRGGRVPGATYLEWTAFLDARGRLRPAREIAQLLDAHKLLADQQAITYCQSGGRASLDAFALELMGFRNVKNYYGSWAEWSSDRELPVETGE